MANPSSLIDAFNEDLNAVGKTELTQEKFFELATDSNTASKGDKFGRHVARLKKKAPVAETAAVGQRIVSRTTEDSPERGQDHSEFDFFLGLDGESSTNDQSVISEAGSQQPLGVMTAPAADGNVLFDEYFATSYATPLDDGN